MPETLDQNAPAARPANGDAPVLALDHVSLAFDDNVIQ
jgi:hypothetical protein